MAVLDRIVLACALALALLAHAGFAVAASNPPKLVIPPRSTNSVICDTRGC